MLNAIARIRELLNQYVIGHDDIKEGILLALLAREHVYIEGAPGTAKTMLAEITARAASLEFYFYQFHRDTRLSELIGDYVIQRDDTEDGEIIRQRLIRGGILTAQLAVLDDITRAPGEALNILLRLLNEREYMGEKLPLITAIATSNPTQDDYYNEPLDLANLDRFAIQLKSNGLISQGSWHEAKAVVDFYTDHIFNKESIEGVADTDIFYKPDESLLSITVSREIRALLLQFLERLVNNFHLDETNSLLTDRTFLVKAVRILKAKAMIEGRMEVIPEDLSVLKYLTTFRVPEEAQIRVDEILTDLVKKN